MTLKSVVSSLEQNSLALEAIVSEKHAVFVRIAHRQLGNWDDAEDAVQDAMLLACKYLPSFREESSLSTWLFAIVINSTRMSHRRRRHSDSRVIGMDDEQVFQIRDAQASPEENCIAEFEHKRALSLINRLSPVLRGPLLHRMADGTMREIAASLNRPVGTVKACLRRARVKVRSRLNPPRRSVA